MILDDAHAIFRQQVLEVFGTPADHFANSRGMRLDGVWLGGPTCGTCPPGFGGMAPAPLPDAVRQVGPGADIGAQPIQDEPCPYTLWPITLPPFRELDGPTRVCFSGTSPTGGGAWPTLDWPKTDCCPVDNTIKGDCEAPSETDAYIGSMIVPDLDNAHWNDGNSNAAGEGFPDWTDRVLFGAGVRVLLANRDIANWATCLVGQWSPEVVGGALDRCIQKLTTPTSTGHLPLHVSWATVPGDGNLNASMWAFTRHLPADDGTLGWIVPLESNTWAGWRNKWGEGGIDAFCAAVEVAGTLLHELIHICADHHDTGYESPYKWENARGAYHEKKAAVPEPCWDEPRMVATTFWWAMVQRYPCLRGTPLVPDP